MKNFEKLGIDESVLRIIEKQGISEPTEIQEKTIPLGLSGKDIVAMSATGSGKTLVFATILSHNIDKERGIQAVILTPTRELTEQVARTVRVFARSKRLEVVEIIGGVPIGPQIHKLKTANVVVGTPGRVLDHLTRRSMKLSQVKLFILDEADRMFDMGFIEDVEKIMEYCPYQKQTLLFSATINQAVLSLADKYMHEPISISAKNFVDPSKLQQVYYDIDKGIKFSLLVHLIKNEAKGLVMVFCNSRKTVDFVQQNLMLNDVEAHALHGGMVQNKRSRVIKDFHSNAVHVLVCTDVAARGLDIKGVEHIYNYNIPRDPTDYIHRIGRTARAGKEGKAINLLSKEEYNDFRKVVDLHKVKIQKLDAPRVKNVGVKKLEERDSQPFKRSGFNKKPNKSKSTGSKWKPKTNSKPSAKPTRSDSRERTHSRSTSTKPRSSRLNPARRASKANQEQRSSRTNSSKRSSRTESTKRSSRSDSTRRSSNRTRTESTKRGPRTESNRRGSRIDSNKRGSRSDSTRHGPRTESNQRSSRTNSTTRGSRTDSTKRSSRSESTARGSNQTGSSRSGSTTHFKSKSFRKKFSKSRR